MLLDSINLSIRFDVYNYLKDMKFLIPLAALFAYTSALELQSHEVELSHEAMVPAFPTTIKCDGNTGKCKMQLQFGRNNYWAVWDAHITASPPA